MKLTKIDNIDKKIIETLQKNPSITHSQIAKNLERSQPAIGARIKKLSEKGVLATQIGVDFSKDLVSSSLNLVKIEMSITNPELVFDMVNSCPYIINALKLSGDYNIMIFMACSSLKRLDVILDKHFRNKDYVRKIKMDLITDFAAPFILPVDFTIENFDKPDELCGIESCPYCEKADLKNLKLKTTS